MLPPATNLKFPQEFAPQSFKSNRELIVLMADKNLVPVLIERKTYISKILGQHLTDSTIYTNLTPEEATDITNFILTRLKSLLGDK